MNTANIQDFFTRILPPGGTLAVVGLSPNPARDSYEVAEAMQQRGFRIVPINPNAHVVLGERAYPSLSAAAQEHRITAVNVFRNSADVPPIVDEAIAQGATGIWLQLGVVHDAAIARAQAAGLVTVQDRCIKVEHRRWLQRQN